MIQLFHDSKNCFENYLKGNYLLRQTIVTEMLHIAQTDHSDFNISLEQTSVKFYLPAPLSPVPHTLLLSPPFLLPTYFV